MSKHWNPNRQTVELRPSRIRRDPPPRPVDRMTVLPDDSENETWAVVIGILAFALAITALIFSASHYFGPGQQPAPITITDAS